MIERLLPPCAIAVAARDEDPDAVALPEEMALLDGAVAARRAEFATARSCARQALRRLGVADAAILRGPQREPVWPPGIVGSITHCAGYRAAAVARETDLLTIGIDAEPHGPLPAGVDRHVLVADELAWLAGAPEGTHWGRVIFGAKECVYKAWFPVARRWLGFDEASVALDPASGSFIARLLVEPPNGMPPALAGRYLVEDGLVLTALAVPRPS